MPASNIELVARVELRPQSHGEHRVVPLATQRPRAEPRLRNRGDLAGWHHVAVTHEVDGTHTMWFDGVLAASAVSMTPIDNVDTARMVIGSRETTPFPPLVGVFVDELRVSSEVLYATDFLPQRPLGVEGAATELYWGFDEGAGEVATDEVVGMEMALNSGVAWAVAE